MKRLCLIAFAMLVVGAPREAAAQGGFFISPFIGTTLSSPSNVGSHTKPGYGLSFGSFGSFIGGETEGAYYPEIFDNTAAGLSRSRVFIFSGDTLVGPMIGPVKIYGALGGGGLYLNVTSISSVLVPNPTSTDSTYFAVNAGGGIAAFFTSNLGVRGDLRYYRAFGFKASDLQNSTSLTLEKFDFWRAGASLVLSF